MNASSLIDIETLTVNANIPLDRFLYVEWNSEKNFGGGGLGHIKHSLQMLIRAYLFGDKPRTIIFSDQFWFDGNTHSPLSTLRIRDLRDYCEIGSVVGFSSDVPVNLYFDYKGIFRDSFVSTNMIGIASKINNRGLSKLRRNNKRILETNQLRVKDLFHLPYNFFCGDWFSSKAVPTESEIIDPTTIKPLWLFREPNYYIKTKAEEIVRDISSLNPNARFCVVHLRRGDRLKQPYFSESSEVNFVAKMLQDQVEAGSSIYIMTNGTPDYISEIKSILSVNFRTFTKEDFQELNELGTADNFKLFAIEEHMGKLANKKFSNRLESHTSLDYPTRSQHLRSYSLQQFWKESRGNFK